ncbi:hypothetical protein T05_11094 [Trichinella murrelli]|uniref:Uncharacterized protein n=1 Tax=Trichinella murrelli TaxID=144512 RepID=A0A0V0U1D4_9BILA|nr:hypothetical protein T05_11094 [Trichinella murrelli]
MEEENKRSAPAVPSSKLEHVKLIDRRRLKDSEKISRQTQQHVKLGSFPPLSLCSCGC